MSPDLRSPYTNALAKAVSATVIAWMLAGLAYNVLDTGGPIDRRTDVLMSVLLMISLLVVGIGTFAICLRRESNARVGTIMRRRGLPASISEARCPSCQCDLTANVSGVCPECGIKERTA